MKPYIPIQSFSHPALDVYARASENQLRCREHPADALFIAESPLVIGRALDAGFQPVSALVEDRPANDQTQAVLDRLEGVPIYTAPMEVLAELTGFRLTRGMLCAMRRKPLPEAGMLLQKVRRVAVLEDVVNPTNVGAIFRSAAALGIQAVLLTPACADPLYRRAIRVSMGTVFQVPWTYLDASWQPQLHSLGFQTAAMALSHKAISIRDPRLQNIEKLAIVLGTEGEGLKDATIGQCDYTVRIPMAPGVDSLNVAAASAVAFYQLADDQTSDKEESL